MQTGLLEQGEPSHEKSSNGSHAIRCTHLYGGHHHKPNDRGQRHRGVDARRPPFRFVITALHPIDSAVTKTGGWQRLLGPSKTAVGTRPKGPVYGLEGGLDQSLPRREAG